MGLQQLQQLQKQSFDSCCLYRKDQYLPLYRLFKFIKQFKRYPLWQISQQISQMTFGVQTLILCALLVQKGSAYCTYQTSISPCSTDQYGDSCGYAGCCLKTDIALKSGTISSASECFPCYFPVPTITFKQNVVDSRGTTCQCGQIMVVPEFSYQDNLNPSQTRTTCNNNVCCQPQALQSGSSKVETGALIGIVIGGVAGIALILVGVYCYLKKGNSASTPTKNEVPEAQVQPDKTKTNNSECKIYSGNQQPAQLRNLPPLKDKHEQP